MKRSVIIDRDAELIPLQTPLRLIDPDAPGAITPPPAGLGAVVLSGVPTAGQVPTATGPGTATWQTPAAGSSADEVFQTEDDGFDSSTLNAKWTQTLSGATLPVVVINAIYARSCYLAKFAGTNAGAAYITQTYAPGAVDFSLTAKFNCSFKAVASALDFFALNAGLTDGYLLRVQCTSAGTTVSFSVLDAGAGYGTVLSATGIVIDRVESTYLHIQRVGTTWTFLYSFDGLMWRQIGATVTKTVTIGMTRIQLIQLTTAVKEWMTADWIRRDWFFW